MFYPETGHEGLIDLLFGGTLTMSEVLCQFQQIMFRECIQNVKDALVAFSQRQDRQSIAVIDRCPDGNRVFAINSRYNSKDHLKPDITKDQLAIYEGFASVQRTKLEKFYTPQVVRVPIYLWADVEIVLDRLKKRDAGSIEVKQYDPEYYWNLERVHFIMMLSKQRSTFSEGNVVLWDDSHSQYDQFASILEKITVRTKEGLGPLKEIKISHRAPKKLERAGREVVVLKVSSIEELLSEPFIDRVMKSLVITSDRDHERLVWLKCNPLENFSQPIYGQLLDLIQ